MSHLVFAVFSLFCFSAVSAHFIALVFSEWKTKQPALLYKGKSILPSGLSL
jgi:hypothetical protein